MLNTAPDVVGVTESTEKKVVGIREIAGYVDEREEIPRFETETLKKFRYEERDDDILDTMIKKKFADIIENLEAEISHDNATFRVLQIQEERNTFDSRIQA